ncbi:MAG: HAMP domain-containing sensor histidine kinase [Firmicutes bacterium]|nr:HAMP domain-containing sensor histidine kinase [Bacillota bacterium]
MLGVVFIGLFSFVSTVLTFFVVSRLATQGPNGEVYAESAEAYVTRMGAAVLTPTTGPELARQLPPSVAAFQVMTDTGRPLYGTVKGRLYTSRADLFAHLNEREIADGNGFPRVVSARLVPVLSRDGHLAGAVYIRWQARMSTLANDPPWVARGVLLLLLCTPFVYIALYTWLFARRLSHQINRPIEMLVQAARKIQMRELDFVIDYHEPNEIGQLLSAFEEMRADLKSSLMRQWALEDERREMLAAVSHDVRTPVTIIQGHADLLVEMQGLPDVVRRYALAIQRNALRIARLLRDFKTVTDVGSPNFALDSSWIDVVGFVRGKLSEYEVLVADRVAMSLEVTDVRADKSLVRLDVDRVAQILDNLASNALEHTPDQGRIDWFVQIFDGVIEVRLHDSGPGFPEADLGRVMQPFYRADPARSGDHAGLGLYIVRELAERHGGTMQVSNSPAGGAVVSVSVRFL